jgi:hypothetical protein
MTSDLRWHRRKGISGLYAELPDNRRYDISMAESGGYDLALYNGNRSFHIGRYAKQVEAKRAAEALPE